MSLRLSIRYKLFLVLAGIGLAALLLAGGALQFYERITFKQRVVAELEALSDMIAVSIYAAVDFNDAATARETLSALNGQPDLVSAQLFGADGRKVATWLRPETPATWAPLPTVDGAEFEAHRVVFTRTLRREGTPFARLVLESSFASRQKQFRESMRILLLVGVVASGLSLLVAMLLQRIFTAPLIKLTHTAESVHASGDFSVRADLNSGDEIGRLAQSLNAMLASIEERDRRLAESHALQHAIVEGSGLAVISADPNGIVRTFNPAAERLLGYRSSEVVGIATPAIWHDSNEVAARAAELSRELQTVVEPGFETFVAKVRHGATDGREWTYVRKNGHSVPVYLVVSALRNRAGTIIGYCGVATDLTERKVSEEALRDSEVRFRRLSESSPVGVFEQDPGGNFLYGNDRWYEIVGLPRNAPTARHWLQQVHPDDLPAVQRDWETFARHDRAEFSAEMRFQHPDNRQRWVQVRARHLHESKGATSGCVGTLTDITGAKVHEHVREILFETLGGTSGQTFFERLAVEIAHLLGAARVFVSHLGSDDENLMIPLVLWVHGKFEVAAPRSPIGGPPEILLKEGTFAYWPDVRARFPARAARYAEWGITSFAGIPLRNLAGRPLGTIGVSFDRPVADVELARSVLQLLASRAALELERLAAEQALRQSEERFRLLIENAADAIVVLDADKGHFITVNRAAERIFELPRDQLFRRSPADMSPERQPDGRLSAEAAREHIAAAIAGDSPVFEWTHRTSTGRSISCEVRLLRIPDAERVLVRGSIIDLSERKRTDAAVQALTSGTARVTGQAFFDATVAQLAGGLGVRYALIGELFDAGGGHSKIRTLALWAGGPVANIVYDLAGTPSEYATSDSFYPFGREVASFFPQDKLLSELGAVSYFGMVINDSAGKPSGLVAVLDDKPMPDSGAARLVLAAAAARASAEISRLEAEGEIQQLNSELEQRVLDRTAELNRRIAEVERLNAEQVSLMEELRQSQRMADRAAAGLQEANSSLLFANTELEAFSYSVSHDLRAPLRNITGFIELMRKRTSGKLDPESDRFLTTVISETMRMGALIDDLLTFSRLGRTAMKFVPVQLAELIEEVKLELHQDIADRAIEWRIAAIPVVQGDRTLLRQVISNLVGNAVKFTRHRAAAVIEIGASSVRPDDPTVTIFFRDNGAGFNPKYLGKLFGVFQRLHNSRDFEGTGIGLANVKRIVTRHGGRVWAEGSVDHGATFYVTLRRAVVVEAPVR